MFSLTKYMLPDKFNLKYKVDYATVEELFEKKVKPPSIDFCIKQSTDDL